MTQKTQPATLRLPQGGLTADCAVAAGRPTFTRPSSIGSYVASKSKTDSGMLHQSRTLKAPAARQRAGSHRNGRGLRHGPQAGWQHGGGERVRKDSVTSRKAAIWPYGQPLRSKGRRVSLSNNQPLGFLPALKGWGSAAQIGRAHV